MHGAKAQLVPATLVALILALPAAGDPGASAQQDALTLRQRVKRLEVRQARLEKKLGAIKVLLCLSSPTLPTC